MHSGGRPFSLCKLAGKAVVLLVVTAGLSSAAMAQKPEDLKNPVAAQAIQTKPDEAAGKIKKTAPQSSHNQNSSGTPADAKEREQVQPAEKSQTRQSPATSLAGLKGVSQQQGTYAGPAYPSQAHNQPIQPDPPATKDSQPYHSQLAAGAYTGNLAAAAQIQPPHDPATPQPNSPLGSLEHIFSLIGDASVPAFNSFQPAAGSFVHLSEYSHRLLLPAIVLFWFLISATYIRCLRSSGFIGAPRSEVIAATSFYTPPRRALSDRLAMTG